ncbi:MAG: phosphoglycerate mutase family protein [Saprospiraceae bacterium]
MNNKILYLPFLLFCLITMSSCVKIPKIQNGGEVQQIHTSKAIMKDGGVLNMSKKDSEGNTTIILVRHAEKMKDQKDPDLTDEGNKRAEKLKNILSSISLDHIYSSDYVRTQQTAKPTATAQRKKVISYNPRALNDFGNMLLENKKGDNILVVGHSNTTNVLLNYFMKETIVESISESDYGNLYIVNIDKRGEAKSLILRF